MIGSHDFLRFDGTEWIAREIEPGPFGLTRKARRHLCWAWAGSLQGLLPGAPTDPGVHVKCTRFVTLWTSLFLTRLGRFAVTRS